MWIELMLVEFVSDVQLFQLLFTKCIWLET